VASANIAAISPTLDTSHITPFVFISWLNNEALTNIPFIVPTEDVSQSDILLLKLLASLNVNHILFTLDVSQYDTSPLKFVAPSNARAKLVTLLISISSVAVKVMLFAHLNCDPLLPNCISHHCCISNNFDASFGLSAREKAELTMSSMLTTYSHGDAYV